MEAVNECRFICARVCCVINYYVRKLQYENLFAKWMEMNEEKKSEKCEMMRTQRAPLPLLFPLSFQLQQRLKIATAQLLPSPLFTKSIIFNFSFLFFFRSLRVWNGGASAWCSTKEKCATYINHIALEML